MMRTVGQQHSNWRIGLKRATKFGTHVTRVIIVPVIRSTLEEENLEFSIYTEKKWISIFTIFRSLKIHELNNFQRSITWSKVGLRNNPNAKCPKLQNQKNELILRQFYWSFIISHLNQRGVHRTLSTEWDSRSKLNFFHLLMHIPKSDSSNLDTQKSLWLAVQHPFKRKTKKILPDGEYL